ncbi:MAG TPA: N-acetylmuramoyl-L-alanine amidase [Solirubrobacteraceae bacterium]|jgi:hypothetical protein|nr:N-acetylmuramoyl-L-alanine amidase [Solirubrobacteraceae bacterium]
MGVLWHPDAVRRIHIDAGGFQGGGRKIVWHTTEGSGLPNYGGSSPHFTLNPGNGLLWQHIPLNRAARALKAGGPNFWNTVQVELIGFAKDSQAWSPEAYENIAKLARWLETNFGVPRKSSVTFKGNGATPHMASLELFKSYEGHIGHQHVPGNDHWDPGKLKIDAILGPAGPDPVPVVRDLARGDTGEDVKVLQAMLVKRGYTLLEPHCNGIFGLSTQAFVLHFQWSHGLNPDGVVGARTRAALGLQATPVSGATPAQPILGEVDGLQLGLGEPLEDHVHVAVGEPADDPP